MDIKKRGFTILEVLITAAIMGMMIALLVPNIDRSLDKNNLSNDVDLFKAKLEEVRLLAGSTQQDDEALNTGDATNDEIGYYGIAVPTGQVNYFDIVRISYPLDTGQPCDVATIINPQTSADCTVERVTLSNSVNLADNDIYQLVAFRIPTQRMVRIIDGAQGWTESSPQFYGEYLFSLTYPGLKAKVMLDDYSGRVTVKYERN